jgi:DNA-binding MarR family transcriptional regulator
MGSHVFDPKRDAAAVMVGLRRIVRMLRVADREAQTGHGLSAAQLFVLHALFDAPAASLAELATRTLTDQSSVSTVVSKLVARRLVSRTIAKHDRRRTELRLTAAGRNVVQRAPRVPQALIANAVTQMPARRRRELVRGLETLIVRVGANSVEPRMMFEEDKR